MNNAMYESLIGKPINGNEYNILKEILLSQLETNLASKQATILLKKFRTIQDIFGASEKDLTNEKNIEPLAIKEITKIKQTMKSILRTNLTSKPIIVNLDNVVNYYKSIFLGKTLQQCHVLLLNEKHEFLAEHCIQIGTVNYINIKPQEIIKAALKYSSTKLIRVRSQPGSYAAPSPQDINLLKCMQKIGPQIQLSIFDYIIIGYGNDCRFLNKKLI